MRLTARGWGMRTWVAPWALLLLGGCAWFRNPPVPPSGAPAGAPGPVAAGAAPISEPGESTRLPGFRTAPGDSVPRSAPMFPETGRGEAAPDSLADTLAPVDTAGAPEARSGELAGEPVGVPGASAAPPGGTSGDSAAVSLEIAEWNLDGTSMAAETGPDGQVIRLEAPVITHGSVRITARRGRFDVDADRAVLEGDVRFEDDGLRGGADHARYYRNQELLITEGHVTAETDTLSIQGEEGTYDRSGEVVFLRGGVKGLRGSRRITADEAEWFRERDEVFFRGNAAVVDTAGYTAILGERIRYDLAADRAEVLESPSLVLSTREETPIRITGERLRVDPSGNAEAKGGVRIVRGGVTAVSDSAFFSRDDRRAILFGDPRVTERDGTLTGDTLTLFFDGDDVLTRLEMHGNSGLRFEPADSARLGESSTVRGDSLTMYFEDDTADRIVVFGNAQSNYRPSPRDRSAGVGTNVVEGDSVTIFIEEGRVERMRVTGGAKGTFRFGTPSASEAAADSLPPDAEAAWEETESDTSAALTTVLSQEPAAESAENPDKVVYAAQEVEYSLEAKTVDLRGEAVLDYGNLNLTAGKVRFYAERRYLEAEEDPVLVDRSGGESKVVGERMDYNLESREGTIGGGRTRSEEGFIYSERLRQIGDDTFLARGGNFTTCDLAEHGDAPHFHFTSKRMKIYLDDKVVAKPVVFYIRDIPVLAIPYYVFSIRKGRHSGFLFSTLDLGIGSDSGRFFRNLGYYWAASQYWDLQFTMDYSDNPSRFVGRALAQYAKRYLMNGTVSVAKTLSSGSDQYDIVGGHQMKLGEWSVTARAEFRDREFRRDDPLSPDFGSRLDRKLLSDASASRSFGFGGSVYLTFRREEDLDAKLGDLDDTVILNETLPQYSFSLNSRPLGRTADEQGAGARLPWLATTRVSFNSSGSHVHTVRQLRSITDDGISDPDTVFFREDDRRTRALHTASLSDTRRLLGALNLTPSFRVNENWVDREFAPGDTLKGFRRAATWSASMGASTALYGTFRGVGAVEGIRHTLRPSATLSYQPEFGSLTYTEMDTTGGDTVFVSRNRYPGVSASRSEVLSLGLDQAFQAKVRSGETTRRVDLFRWTMGSSYDFLAKEQGRRGWSLVSSTFDLPQIYGVGLSFNSSHDPYEKFRFQTFQTTAGYGLSGKLPGGGDDPEAAAGESGIGEGSDELETRGADLALRDRRFLPGGAEGGDALTWNAGLTLSYAGQRRITDFDTGASDLQTNASVNARAAVRITRNWSIDYNMRWDVTRGEILGNNLNLTRQIHCWEAQFSRSELGDETTFYFRLNIKEMPDIRYEQGRQGGTSMGSLTQFLP